MPYCFEDICYVGDCPVCGGGVDLHDSGTCEVCGQAFHWSDCGGWFDGKHMCDNCQPADKSMAK
jgi:hypothetical protein